MGDNMIDKEKAGIHEKNVTKYGEFVCTTHQWLPLDKQKKDAEEFEKITKNGENRRIGE